MIGLIQRLEKINTTKDLKPLRNEWWVRDMWDFLNWLEVTGATGWDVVGPLSVIHMNIPEDGPFKSIRLDLYRYLGYELEGYIRT